MKKIILLTLVIMICASIAYGQAGYIGLYMDPIYTLCDILDVAPALVPVYAVHKACPGAVASQWKVMPGGGFNCTYTGEIVALPTSIGSTQSGISIAYGGCLPSDILLVTINYFCMGASPPCASLTVVPDPAAPSGTIEVIDCFYVKLVGGGGIFYMNPDGSCDCRWTPVKDSSWGQIKALYN